MSRKSLQVKETARADTKVLGALIISTTNSQVTVDSSKLTAPDRLYDADLAWISCKAARVSIYFAKKNLDDPQKLASRLEIRFPAEDFLTAFLNISRTFYETLKTYTQRWPVEVRASTSDAEKQLPAERSHSEWANFSHMAFSGSEASADFYHVPPSGIARYSKDRDTSGLDLRPVVRVLLTSFELLGVLDAATQLESELREVVPDVHRKTEPLADQG